VPRQQSNFTGDDAEFRPARAARRGRHRVVCRRRCVCYRRQLCQNIGDGAAKIEIDGSAGHAIENEDRRILTAIEQLLRRTCDVAEITGGDAAVALEGDEGAMRSRVHRHSLI